MYSSARNALNKVKGLILLFERFLRCYAASYASISYDEAPLALLLGHNRQRTYFDVRVFNPFCCTIHNVPLPQCCRRAELEKKRAYEENAFGKLSLALFAH